MPSYNKADIQRRMHGAVEALKHDLGGLRTGRASTTLLDPVHVDVYGASMPLNQVATVSVPEPRMLSVQVWDRSNIGAVEKAIRNADLGMAARSRPVTSGRQPPSLLFILFVLFLMFVPRFFGFGRRRRGFWGYSSGLGGGGFGGGGFRGGGGFSGGGGGFSGGGASGRW